MPYSLYTALQTDLRYLAGKAQDLAPANVSAERSGINWLRLIN